MTAATIAAFIAREQPQEQNQNCEQPWAKPGRAQRDTVRIAAPAFVFSALDSVRLRSGRPASGVSAQWNAPSRALRRARLAESTNSDL